MIFSEKILYKYLPSFSSVLDPPPRTRESKKQINFLLISSFRFSTRINWTAMKFSLSASTLLLLGSSLVGAAPTIEKRYVATFGAVKQARLVEDTPNTPSGPVTQGEVSRVCIPSIYFPFIDWKISYSQTEVTTSQLSLKSILPPRMQDIVVSCSFSTQLPLPVARTAKFSSSGTMPRTATISTQTLLPGPTVAALTEVLRRGFSPQSLVASLLGPRGTAETLFHAQRPVPSNIMRWRLRGITILSRGLLPIRKGWLLLCCKLWVAKCRVLLSVLHLHGCFSL
jgi:hypothetical protein